MARPAGLFLAALVTAALMLLFAWSRVDQLGEQALQRTGEQAARLLRQHIDSELGWLSSAARLMAAEEPLGAALRNGRADAEAAAVLNRYCERLAAQVCYLLDRTGLTLDATNRNDTGSFVGKRYDFRPYFRLAMNGEAAIYPALGVTSGQRGLYFSAPVAGDGDAPLGVAVIKYGPEHLETHFDSVDGETLLVNGQGIIFLASEASWRLRPLQLLERAQLEPGVIRQFGELKDPVGLVRDRNGRVKDSSGREFIQYSLALKRLPDWSVVYLSAPGAPSRQSVSGLLAGLGGIIVAFVALVLLFFRQADRERRAALAMGERLRESEERFRRLSEITCEAIFVHKGGVCLDANRTAERMFGYSRDELMGMNAKEIIDSRDHPELLRRIGTGSEEPYEVTAVRRDGSRFPAEIVGHNILWNGERLRVTSIRDISERKAHEAELVRQACHDTLTGLPNRLLCRERIQNALGRLEAQGGILAVVFVDLDDFKKINDSLGHQIGDELIRHAAARLKRCLQPEDTLSRHGGDEFVLVLERESEAEIEPVLREVVAVMANPFAIDGMDLVVTASVGVALAPRDGTDYPTLMRNADVAMYRAKAEGKNGYHFFTRQMNEEAQRHLALDRGLRRALAANELSLVYQPIWNQAGEQILSAEALLRWNSEELGFVSPAEFIPLAEQTGIVVEIGEWVLEEACARLRSWLDGGLGIASISVNVSPRQLKRSNFVAKVEAALRRNGLEPRQLVLEVTEGMLIENDPRMLGALTALAELGVRLSLDDFGTGYSSLSYLRRLPFSYLKIDRSFVMDCTESRRAKGLLRAIIAMSHGLGLSVVAEGVETQEQLALLQRLNCDRMQGYLLGKPMPAELFVTEARRAAAARGLSEYGFL